MTDHLAGRKVSKATYSRGCRCDGCTAAATKEQRRSRQQRDGALLRVQGRVTTLTLAWARQRMTAEDREAIRAQAYRDLGIERRRPGQRHADDRKDST